MRPSLALRLSSHIQLTLFTRANCGLCDVAKSRIGEFITAAITTDKNKKKNKSPVDYLYAEIDIMDPPQSKWRDVYEFDVPVLHIDRVSGETSTTQKDYAPTLDAAKKLMHRFTVQEVENAVHEVERGSPS